MNHNEAMQELATERYLLDELSPELREAFEEHMFDCQECAFDVRAGNVFLSEAKVQLPQIAAAAAAPETQRAVVREVKSHGGRFGRCQHSRYLLLPRCWP